MHEIYRSRDMISLVQRKQFLEENDIPCRILLEETDITELPSHPVYGLSYHLEEPASLMVDEEDLWHASALLNNTENPLGQEDGDIEGRAEGDDEKAPAGKRGFGAIILLLLALISVFWLFYAAVFLSAPFSEDQVPNERTVDSFFILSGIAMILIWVFGFLMIIRQKHKS